MKLSQSIALSALAAAWLAAAPAQAAQQNRMVTVPAAHLCTLSIPTTNTGVRPKATGFRNEGTGNAFVICAFDSAPGLYQFEHIESVADPSEIAIYFASIDGKSHEFDCTGVNSWPMPSALPMQYVVKHVSATPSNLGLIDFVAEDFGGELRIPTSGALSVTCSLPAGVSILVGELWSKEDVGS